MAKVTGGDFVFIPRRTYYVLIYASFCSVLISAVIFDSNTQDELDSVNTFFTSPESTSTNLHGFQEGTINAATFASNNDSVCFVEESQDSVSCSLFSLEEGGGIKVSDSYKINGTDVGKPDSISSSQSHSCLINTRKIVLCWEGEESEPNVIEQIRQPVASISSGNNFSCASSYSGEIWCWSFEEKNAAMRRGRAARVVLWKPLICADLCRRALKAL